MVEFKISNRSIITEEGPSADPLDDLRNGDLLLKVGVRGNAVAELNRRLGLEGDLFTEQTEDRVYALQTCFNITKDGKVGTQTTAALDEINYLRMLFELPQNGKFDTHFESCIREFQCLHKLDTDGILGDSTRQKIDQAPLAYLGFDPSDDRELILSQNGASGDVPALSQQPPYIPPSPVNRARLENPTEQEKLTEPAKPFLSQLFGIFVTPIAEEKHPEPELIVPDTASQGPDPAQFAIPEVSLRDVSWKMEVIEEFRIEVISLGKDRYNQEEWLEKSAWLSFQKMNAAFRADHGEDLPFIDGYRSATEQQDRRDSRGKLASPVGRSMHELGLAIDIEHDLVPGSEQWLASNAPNFGFFQHPHPKEKNHYNFLPEDPNLLRAALTVDALVKSLNRHGIQLANLDE